MENKLAKISASPEADQALDRMVAAVNDGFSGGRVTKHDFLSWIVLQFEKNYLTECIEAIRRDHFDQLAYLEGVLAEAKRARREGKQEMDIAVLLAQVARSNKTERHKSRTIKNEEITSN